MAQQTYRITHPQTGQVIRMTGAQPPTEAEIRAAFDAVSKAEPTQQPQAQTEQPRDPMAEAMRGPIADTQKPIADPVSAGIGKGIFNTALGMVQLAHKIPGVTAASDAVQRAVYGDVVPADQLISAARAETKPQGTAENIGFGIEQTAEFFVPGGAVKRGAQALAKAAPKVAGASRGAAEAVSAGAVSGVQGGDPLTAAGIAGAVPVVGAGISRAVPALREQAAKKVFQALGPTKERYKAMASRLTPEIQKRGLGGSRESLAATAAETAETVGAQIDEAIQEFGARGVDTAPIVSALETAKDAFRTFKSMPLEDAVKSGANRAKGARVVGDRVEIPVVFEPRAIRQLEGLQGVIADLGPNPRVDQLIAVRRAWDKVVDQAGGYSHRAGGAIGVPLKDQTEAWAKREATGAIRKLLAEEVPELAALNKEFAFWKGLESVLTQTLQRTAPQSKGLLNATARGAGQVVGGVAGSSAGAPGAIGGALIAGKVASTLEAMFTSPRFRFVDAKLRTALADALTTGYRPRIEHAIARITAAMGGGGALQPSAAR